MKTQIDFINGGTRRCLLAMALPMLAAMFLNMAYNLVDSLWIGNLLGETAYAALTNSTPIILILNSFAMGITNGTAILLSHAIGANEQEQTEHIIATSLIVSVLLALVITAGLELSLKPLLRFLKTPTETFQMAYDYLAIYLPGYLAVYLYCYFTAVLRSFGNSVFQVTAMLLCTILNAVLDPILICFMGFSGAATATILSQSVCLLAMLFYLFRRKLFAFRLSAFRREYIVPYFSKGIPAAFQQSIPAFSTSFLTALVGGYGITALASYGIAGKLETLLFYPAMALNMVLTAIVGQCTGGRRIDRAKDYLRTALLYGSGLLVFLSLIIVCFSRSLSLLFVNSPAAAKIVGNYFMIVGIGYVLNTVTNCFLGAVNGLGKPLKSMMCMVLYYIVVRIPLSWVFSHAGFGLPGIWTAVLISHILAAVIAGFAFQSQSASGAGADCQPASIPVPDTSPVSDPAPASEQ